MFIRALSLFDTQRLYRTRKSAVAAVLVAAVAAGGNGLNDFPLLTTSAREGELETGKHCDTSCSRLDGDPAGRPAPTTLPVSGGDGAARGQTMDGR
jgi:hypothetical protein